LIKRRTLLLGLSGGAVSACSASISASAPGTSSSSSVSTSALIDAPTPAAAAAPVPSAAVAVAGTSSAAPGSAAAVPAAPVTLTYGALDPQFVELTVPGGEAPAGGWPVVVLIHGGYWRAVNTITQEYPTARTLAAAGYAVWNVEYRSLGNGGGYPQTFQDISWACDLLVVSAEKYGLDASRVVIVGHSAGGPLALWAAARHKAARGTMGASAPLKPVGVVSQAGVNDFRTAADAGFGLGVVASFLHGKPAAQPAIYAQTSPMQILPIGVPKLVVIGSKDTSVPQKQTTSFAAAAKAAGDVVAVQVVAGDTHGDCLKPASKIFAVTEEWIGARLGG
jgi:acetyl esterase/lipase